MIRGHNLEFLPDSHTYLVDGIIVPSITQILKVRFGHMYDFVSRAKLQERAAYGNIIHAAIENYEMRSGEMYDYKEFRNYLFLKKRYGFEYENGEQPVILFDGDNPIAAGRFDILLRQGDELGLGDIKTTSTLNKEYVGYQLNLYRIAFQQCYEQEITFLRALHLRDDVRKYVELPINEELAKELIKEYFDSQEPREEPEWI